MKGQEEGREQESEAAGYTHSLATRTGEIPAEESLPSGVTANPPDWDFILHVPTHTHPPPITLALHGGLPTAGTWQPLRPLQLST